LNNIDEQKDAIVFQTFKVLETLYGFALSFTNANSE